MGKTADRVHRQDGAAEGDKGDPPVKAAAYVRMSTEHQRYSTSNQMEVISTYAGKHNLEIVTTYADDGKSGLNLAGREGLKRLLDDVERGAANFRVILVYDISRWGRFQDADESAYYEFVCKRAGLEVVYCAELFANDGSPTSTIVKSVKRAMAGEYSRELSTKVFHGQCNLVQRGYRQGGAAGFGLRRMLIDDRGEDKGLLHRGDRKSLQTDRVILVPGPRGEVETVRWMYRAFVHEGMHETEIAQNLNRRGIRTDLGKPWTRGTVHQVLTNEKYIGNNVYNRTSFKLKQRRVVNAPEMWVWAEDAFRNLVDKEIFYVARGMIMARVKRFSDEEMLDRLKALFSDRGRISALIIDEQSDMPSSSAYRGRFGSLIRAYRLVGYTPDRDYRYLEINRNLRQLYPRVVEHVTGSIENLGGTISVDAGTDLLTVNGEFTTSIVICRCRQTAAGSLRWLVHVDQGLAPDITVAVRMDPDNREPLDYYLLPLLDVTLEGLRMAQDNGVYLDIYRFETLEWFFGMAEQVRVGATA